jgi:vacuolar-type H+-ATPase subunit H
MAQLTDPRSDPVVGAIERVLGAERDGEATLRDVRQQAEALLAAARAEAAVIARRADARISKLHAAYLHKIQQEIEKLTGSHTVASEVANNTYDLGVLSNAACRLAAKLTSKT